MATLFRSEVTAQSEGQLEIRLPRPHFEVCRAPILVAPMPVAPIRHPCLWPLQGTRFCGLYRAPVLVASAGNPFLWALFGTHACFPYPMPVAHKAHPRVWLVQELGKLGGRH